MSCNPIALLAAPDNISSKARTLSDAMSRLLDDTAEMTDPHAVAAVADIVRNLDELRRQLLQLPTPTD